MSVALAGPLPGSAIESPVGRFLLGETQEGLSLMSRVLGRKATLDDIEEFYTRLKTDPKLNRGGFREELEGRIGRMREQLQEARQARAGGKNVAETDAFAEEERFVLRKAAERDLKLSGSIAALDASGGQIDFVQAGKGATDSVGEKFLDASAGDDRIVQIDAKPGEKAPKEVQEQHSRWLRNWYKESRECVAAQDKSAVEKGEMRDMLQQLAISAGNNTVTYLVTTGISQFDVGEFSVDIGLSLLATGAAMKWLHRTDSVQVSWLKMTTLGVIRNPIDAEIYRINPWTDTHGVPIDTAVAKRQAYNYYWTTRASWVSPVVFAIFTGAECLIGEAKGAEAAAKFAKGAFVSKFGIATGMNLIYYRTRGKYYKSHAQ